MDKAVIFIVEGATDKKALENIFKKIYRYKEIHFEFTHGDITSDENIDKSNVETEIYKFVDRYRKDKKLKLVIDLVALNLAVELMFICQKMLRLW